MRLAFLTHEPFYPPSGGGSAEALYLVEEMVRRGYEVHVFCPRLDDPAAVRQRFGVRLHEFTAWRMGRYARWRTIKYALYPLALARQVQRTVQATPPDVIFAQHSVSALAAGWLRRRLQRPIVMNFLDFLTGFLETWPRYLMPPPIVSQLKAFELHLPVRYHADAVLAVSDTLADELVARGFPRERVQPIYFGYDAALFDPAKFGARAKGEGEAESALHAPASAPAGPPVVVMHGSLDHHHLGAIAVEAVAHVARVRPEVVFRFIGQRTAALERLLRRVAATAPAARVECLGFVPYAEVAAHLAQAAVGIVPYEESRGVHCAFVAKVVEYLGLGLPTVCTPLQSLRRYFGDEPLIRFSEFDGASFGERILSWLQEPVQKRRQLAPAAIQRVRAALDWRVISRRALDFVEDRLALRSAGPPR